MPREVVPVDRKRELDADDARNLSVRGLSRSITSTGTPVKPRGSAFPELSVAGQIAQLFHNYAPLGYMLPFEALDYIELLSAYNSDFSQAVDNVRTLANSGHNLFIDSPYPRTAAQIKERIEDKARTIQPRVGGIDGLIDALLDQAAVYGAMCGEWTVDEELTDVVDFTIVNPKHIRFFWEDEIQDWGPYQKVNMIDQEVAEERGQKVRNGCIQLNPLTFHYYSFDAAPGNPYGTPPFLAALPNIAIQRDMINNMAQIVKKVGLLGIVDMSVQGLKPRPGETDGAFQARATAFLDEYVTVVEDMVRDGGVVHFDDVNVQTYNVAGNAAGATNIFKQNEELIFSGLKSMPSVQGRSYSTTETYAGVAYDIIIRNTYKYQRAVKSMIEAGYWLMCFVWNLQPTDIRLEFNSNKSLHRLQDAQAFRLEIFNAVLLWAIGIINQQDVAQTLGFQEPKTVMEEPPTSPLLGPPPQVGISAKESEEPSTSPAQAKLMKLVGQIADVISEMNVPDQGELADV